MKLLTTLLLLVITNLHCMQTQKASAEFRTLLNQKSEVNQKIKFDGVYHHITENSLHHRIYDKGVLIREVDTPFLHQPIYFFSNGLLLYEFNLTTIEADDLSLADKKSAKNFYNEHGWGVYTISHDTIHAIIYVDFRTDGFPDEAADRLLCNFQGLIKNSDTLLQWRMVPPFPKFNKRYEYNSNILNALQNGVDMYYKEVPQMKQLDPAKAWINRFKN